MPNFQYGIAGLAQGALSRYSEPVEPKEKILFSARVKDIILDESNPLFKQYGEWASIGMVLIEDVTQPTNTNSNTQAYPLFPNIKQYPLLNEVVVVISLPSTGLESSTTSNRFYYFPPINVWGSQHHNAIPGISTLPPSQQKDYEQTSAGSVRRVTDGGTEINLGKGFVEQIDINPLQPYIGDYILEGRFGNSIRFGGYEGKEPIIKIRNGQGPVTNEGWTTVDENINEDKASVYLSTNQQVPIESNTYNYNSYNVAPESTSEYSDPQVLINSGRLVFNANSDSVLISSAKSINLNSQDSVNIDSQNVFVVNSPNILLGDKDATEPLLKGDITIELLSELVDEMRKWMTQFNANPSPYLAYLKASSSPLIGTLVKLKSNLETKTKSKVSKTI
tara:strand:- start:329 stop:1504 length:1176 start_codon:yes stop_codon:yes gene_type:complete